MEQIKLSRASKSALGVLWDLYSAGEVFAPGEYRVRRTVAVVEARRNIAEAVAKDVAKHLGVKSPKFAQCTVLYNLKCQFEVPVGHGYCGIAVYDYSTGICYSVGVRKCQGGPAEWFDLVARGRVTPADIRAVTN